MITFIAAIQTGSFSSRLGPPYRDVSSPRIRPSRLKARDMSMKDGGGRSAPSDIRRSPDSNGGLRPVSDAALAMRAALATALVLGYLLLDARTDISREENCMLPRSRNCGAIELHPDR